MRVGEKRKIFPPTLEAPGRLKSVQSPFIVGSSRSLNLNESRFKVGSKVRPFVGSDISAFTDDSGF